MDQESIVGVTKNGKFRARLERDEYPVNPRRDYDHIAHVITPQGQRDINVDEDGGPLQHGWDHFADRDDAVDLFTRWARIFHGAVVVEDRPVDGAWSIWYMTPEQIGEISNSPEEAIAIEVQEYRNWADGEVYAYIIEERIAWKSADASRDESMDIWERVDSCGDLNGADYAKNCALEELRAWR